MKEIKTEHYVDIYPFMNESAPDHVLTHIRNNEKTPPISRITAFPDGSVHIFGQTLNVTSAEAVHLALGRAIELAGGW